MVTTLKKGKKEAWAISFCIYLFIQPEIILAMLFMQWLNLLKSMLKEAEWLRDKSVPSMDEYMTNGYVSFALGPIVLPALYCVGPKLSEEIVRTPELHHLYEIMSTCGRLLNDIQTFKVQQPHPHPKMKKKNMLLLVSPRK